MINWIGLIGCIYQLSGHKALVLLTVDSTYQVNANTMPLCSAELVLLLFLDARLDLSAL